MGVVTEYILAYAKEKKKSPPFLYGTTTKGKKYPVNNAGNPLARLTFPAGSVVFKMADQVVPAQDMSGGNIVTRLITDVTIEDGTNKDDFILEGEWRYSQKKLDAIINAGESLVISKIPFRPNHIKDGGRPKKMKNLLSIAHYKMATNEDATAESEALFGHENAFENPKPELLIATLLDAVTAPGDLVLDSFLGSGTTAAVAHKMGRRWIGIELGDHCYTHCKVRLDKVIDGEDPGGITEAVGWKGSGGYRFFELAPTLVKEDQWGQSVINPDYKPEMLAEAVCKLEGFTYAPSETEYFIHGHSTERDYIYVTTNYLKVEHLRALGELVGSERTLLICCKGFEAGAKQPNLTVKKIPQAILEKCEYGRDDYSRNVKNLPMSAPEEERNDQADSESQMVQDDLPLE